MEAWRAFPDTGPDDVAPSSSRCRRAPSVSYVVVPAQAGTQCPFFVVPAQAGTQCLSYSSSFDAKTLGPRLRGDDDMGLRGDDDMGLRGDDDRAPPRG